MSGKEGMFPQCVALSSDGRYALTGDSSTYTCHYWSLFLDQTFHAPFQLSYAKSYDFSLQVQLEYKQAIREINKLIGEYRYSEAWSNINNIFSKNKCVP